MIIHLDGHAILRSDLESILDYCDVRLLGKSPGSGRSGPGKTEGNLFLEDNRDRLDPLFDSFLP